MKYQLLLTLFLIANISVLTAQIKFPEDDLQKGYEYSEVHARVAFPIDGNSRIWLKGSSTYHTAKIIQPQTKVILAEVNLLPPYYTHTIIMNADEVTVDFCSENLECFSYANLYPNQFKNSIGGNFSVMLYGCLEPFHIKYDENKKPISEIFEGENNSSRKVRSLFNKVSNAKPVMFLDSVKENWTYKYDGTKNTLLLKSAPKLIITTGDQVYVDAGYGVKMKSGVVHPLSAWETKRRPHLFNDSLDAYQSYLNKLYNASYSFNDLEAAHRRLPLLPTIDDHELRDGWGSQGDEYEKGMMNPELKGAFMLGKQAFIEHQLLLSNQSVESARANLNESATLNYAFEVNGKHGYVFDLRIARNIKKKQLLGEEQWKHFENWLSQLEPNQEIILITSVPLTLRPLKWIEDIYKLFKPELRDDVRDGWSSDNNIEDRNRLIALLTQYRIKKDIKPIFVSGDVHKSALIEIWVDPYVGRNSRHDPKETMILGYEVVASGISHEFLKTGLSKSIFKLLESQRVGDGFIDFTYEGNRASIYPMVWKSIVAQNFAAIEFFEQENTKIHTFIYDQSEDTLEQHILELDFNKKLPNDDYFITNDRGKKNFTAPLPHRKRVILQSN